jgi:uncharacterized phage protein (TIGR01671 family)
MREILFRGKRIDNSEWVYGDLMHKHYNFNTKADKVIHNNVMKYKVIPETVGQFTGLTDKNGKKIFEGDVVKVFDNRVGVVVYGSGMFFVQPCEREAIYMFEIGTSSNIEIIGNIHDNPELAGDE